MLGGKGTTSRSKLPHLLSIVPLLGCLAASSICPLPEL